VIGSKAFTESVLTAELMAQWIERRTTLHVDRRFYLGSTQICFEALREGEIDAYPEYTGTGLVMILGRPASPDRARVLADVRDEFDRRYRLAWLVPLGFENSYALAMPRTMAARLGIRTVSDLVRHPELHAGFAPEFFARADGYPGLAQRYGLHFDDPPRSLEAGLMYAAAAHGRVDVVSAYSTDGRVERMGLALLEDDLRFFPPYEAVPVVREALVQRHPDVAASLRSLAGRVSTERMRRMNLAVDLEHRAPSEVVRELVAEIERDPR
jgi:glycine betaine/choline ABC-type transport system substrate-binding protein